MGTRSRVLSAVAFGGIAAGAAMLYRRYKDGPRSHIVNDVHAQINPTRVCDVLRPASLAEARRILKMVARRGEALSIAGGRHAMGGQQFGSALHLIDTRRLDAVLAFDGERGEIEVEAGIEWPALVEYLQAHPVATGRWWGIAQKQTGADLLTLGGSISANVHGRGLQMKPLISDIVSFTILDAEGTLHRCSREENSELFRLAIGGYGLFGLLYSVRLRLVPRRKLERTVEVIDIGELTAAVDERVEAGFLYGDFQFATDEGSEDFLRKGIFSCYGPLPQDRPIPDDQKAVSLRAWRELVYLAHADKSRAFRLYADYYLGTTGQVYWSDTHQMAGYLDDYHRPLDRRLHSERSTEVITEIFVPRQTLCAFMADMREDFRRYGVNLIYGTIRMTEQDDESYLAWAKQRYACVIFNLHTEHTPQGLEHSAAAFRRLIDRGIQYGGGYYLTYHRYATAEQVLACYPQFPDFLRLKRQYDPAERFMSDWYLHHVRLLGHSAGL